MKKKYCISILSTILCCAAFTTASALTIVNNYRESSQLLIGKPDYNVENDKICSQITLVKLYSKKDNGPTPSITFMPKDFPQNELNLDTICLLMQHPGEAMWRQGIDIEFKNSENCELFINSEHSFTAGPGCKAKNWN